MSKTNNIWFAPLAALYGLGVGIRNLCYEHGLFRSHKVGLPTICVGNLAVGGTGKTPHVEWLIRFLTQENYRVAVLSRGYRRKTHGFYVADENSTALQLGDECMQLHRKFPDVTIAVCENRVRGIHMLQCHCPAVQVVILDDAFQHRRLECGFNILLTTADNLYVNDHFLPWGRLRDSAHQSLRANTIIVTKCPDNMTAIDRRTIIHELHVPAYQQLLFSSVRYADWSPDVEALPASARVLVVAGIAHPEYLFEHVRKRFPNAELRAYGDHHAFTRNDIARLEQAAQEYELVLTTEKDMSRLSLCELSDQLKQRLYPVEIEISILDDVPFKEQIRHYLAKLNIN